MNEKKWVQIWYSWGDQEPPVEVPENVDPWEYTKKLAVTEADISFTEHEDEGEIGLSFFREIQEIILHYPFDDQCCFYRVTDTKEYDPWNSNEVK